MLVEPFNGLTMLVTRPLDNPNDHFGTLAGGIGDEFALVVVVGVFQLVFYEFLFLFCILEFLNKHFGMKYNLR